MDISDDNHDQPQLPGLGSADTRWLVDEAIRVLRDLGKDPVRCDDGVSLALPGSPGNMVLGLGNLALTVWRLPRRKWRRAVRDQMQALMDLDPTAPVADADLRPKLTCHLEDLRGCSYQPLEPLPGVFAVLAAQGKKATSIFGTLDQIGHDRDHAYDLALSNLASLRLPRHSRRRVDKAIPESWIEFFDSPDACGAARVLLLPEMFRRVLRREIPETGVLVAVPTKHELWVHLPVNAEDTMNTALRLAHLAFQTCVEDPYAITPDIFLVSPDMHASVLLIPDAAGVDVHRETMAGLLASLEFPRAS